MRNLVDGLWSAARVLRRAPAFTAVAVLTLGLGIGAATTLFSIIEQLFLRRLPVPEPQQLVVLQPPVGPFSGHSDQSSDFSVPMSHPEFEGLRDFPGGPFSGVLARCPVSLSLADGTSTERVAGELVSGTYFPVLGVDSAVGRLLGPEDDRVPRAHPVAVLSYASWQRRFGADPGVVGRVVRVNGQPMTILGVAAKGFAGVELGRAPEIFLPMMEKAVATPLADDLDNPRARWLNIMARLRPGVTREQATVAVNVRYRQLNERDLPLYKFHDKTAERFLAKRLTLLPGAAGRSDLRGEFARMVGLLLGMVGLLLVLTCANLANLFAARVARREPDVTVRLAIGGSRSQVVRSLLAEALLVGLLGAALGTTVACAAPDAFLRLLPRGVSTLTVAPSPAVLLLALGLALLCGLGLGIAPALQATSGDMQARLRESGAGGWRRALVGTQVALSALLLVGAGLLGRSLVRLLDRDPGFRTQGILLFSIDASLNGYGEEQARALGDRLENDLAALPGVETVARGETRLLNDEVTSNSVQIPGYQPREDESMDARFDTVSPSYFRTLDMPLRAGRGFLDSDRRGSRPVAVVTERFVERFLRGRDPLGLTIKHGRDDQGTEIVGVVRGILTADLREDEEPFVYVPYGQAHRGGVLTFYLRSARPAAGLAADVRRVVAAADPQLPVFHLNTLAEQARESVAVGRAAATIAVALGGLSALLAALGLYGVQAAFVAGRRREIGVRAALGADRGAILRYVLGSGMWPVGIGLAIGNGVALPAALLLRRSLFGVGFADPATFAAVGALLLLAALLACAGPAWRALRVEPAAALREE